jgi:nucleoside-diphosphate-sugar epimerase
VVGRACGELLANDDAVFYAGRKNADFPLDVASPDARLPEGLRFDVVIHVAADFGGRSDDDWFRAESVNALGALNACRLARQVAAGHLLIVSTISARYEPHHGYYGIYSLSKRHGEELAQLYCRESGLSLTILRPSQIYDADSKCRKHQPFFYTMIDKAQQGDDIEIFGSNDASRNLLFLGDLAEIMAATLQKKVLGVFTCSAPTSLRLSEIAAVARQVFARGGCTRFRHDKPDIADIPALDGQQDLYAAIQYAPATSLAEGILKIKQARETP